MVIIEPRATVNIHAAKTHFSRLVEQAERGEETVIARNGRPVARLVPYHEHREPRNLATGEVGSNSPRFRRTGRRDGTSLRHHRLMRLLLDTHALLWWLAGGDELRTAAYEAIASSASVVHVSAASAWRYPSSVPRATSTLRQIGRCDGSQWLCRNELSTSHTRSWPAPLPLHQPLTPSTASSSRKHGSRASPS